MYLADCVAGVCEWDYLVEEATEAQSERLGRLIEAIHVLVKHPDQYREFTGKDPDQACVEYEEVISAIKRIL